MPRKNQSDPKNLKHLIPPVGEWRFLRDEFKTSRFNAGDRVLAEIYLEDGVWHWGVLDNRTGFTYSDTGKDRNECKSKAEAKSVEIKDRKVSLPPDAKVPRTKRQNVGLVVGLGLMCGSVAYAIFTSNK